MVARSLDELVVYQLAEQLRNKTIALTATGRVVNDRKFCDQMRDAASSVTRNIAEGFGRYRHKEFANFLIIARGSVFELSDHLRDGVTRRYWANDSVLELYVLCKRTSAGVTRLIHYLKSHPDPS
jgi:four helix bundle protein